jgi:hypothetical protein
MSKCLDSKIEHVNVLTEEDNPSKGRQSDLQSSSPC